MNNVFAQTCNNRLQQTVRKRPASKPDRWGFLNTSANLPSVQPSQLEALNIDGFVVLTFTLHLTLGKLAQPIRMLSFISYLRIKALIL